MSSAGQYDTTATVCSPKMFSGSIKRHDHRSQGLAVVFDLEFFFSQQTFLIYFDGLFSMIIFS
jgi:hypothetical protein